MARALAKNHDTKRQKILKQAASVFAVEGFDRASMVSVAEACGISKANIYHYYASKDDLLFGILDNYLSALRDKILFLEYDTQDPEARFRITVKELLLSYEGADNEHQLQLSAMTQLTEAKQAVLKGYQLDLVRQMTLLIAATTPSAGRKNATKQRSITMSVFGMLNWYYMWNEKKDKQARIKYAKLICDLTLDGIRKKN